MPKTTNETATDDSATPDEVCPLVTAFEGAIGDAGATKRDVAEAYTMAMFHSDAFDMAAAGRAIEARWSADVKRAIKRASVMGDMDGVALFNDTAS